MKTNTKKIKNNWVSSKIAHNIHKKILTDANKGKKRHFNEGDEVILVSGFRNKIEWCNWIEQSGIKVGDVNIVAENDHFDWITLKSQPPYNHAAAKFRKVERVKLKPIATDKLKHGDIVKFTQYGDDKYVVAYSTKSAVYFYPTRKNHYLETEGLVGLTRQYSVIVYKLLNLKDLCK